MWFLYGKPQSLKVEAVISSEAQGYQANSYRFQIGSSDSELWIALAFPWSPNKKNGSFQVTEKSLLPESDDCQLLENFEIVEKPRRLRRADKVSLMNVQELINWYLDDFGFLTAWVQPGKWYQLNFKHKIDAESVLFFPTRLPSVIAESRPEMTFNLTVRGVTKTELAKCLTLSHSDAKGDHYNFAEWGWDTDTRFHTTNWDSSDDSDSDEGSDGGKDEE